MISMDASTFALTLWRTFSRGRRAQYTWRSFVDTFVRDPEVVRYKESVAGFSLASFDGNRRTLARVEQVHALVLDFDHGDTAIQQAARLFPGTWNVAHTTFSHTPEHPKLRVILPFERPVSAEEYARIWGWAARKITRAGRVLDESASDASRFWYLPSHRPGAPYEWRELPGRSFDVSRALREAPPHSRPLSGPVQARERQALVSATGMGRECEDADADQTFFGRAFVLADMAFDPLESGALPVVCPWGSEHTSGADGDTSTVVLPPTTDAGWGLFHCSHAHCAKRKTLELLDVLPLQALVAARREHGGGLVRTRVRAGFVQHLDAVAEFAALDRFVLRCYPTDGGAPLIWTVKIESRAHVEGLDSLPLRALRGRHVDLAVRGREITWGRLAPERAGE